MEGTLVEVLLSVILIPWVTWVSASIFNQRQEIALMKQTHDDMRVMTKELIHIFSKHK